MPKRNRVTPFGEIIAVPDRGTFMGNRGVLHDDRGRIVREWKLKRWLICLLEFKNRKRIVMTPGRWTELFFLDEATALAAGHRPCAECRRKRYTDFCTAWAKANGRGRSRPLRAAEIDEQLHRERVEADYSKKMYRAILKNLPDGVMVTFAESRQPWLLWRGRLHAWSPGGYRAARRRQSRTETLVLTPKSTVRAIQAGYVPEIHLSAASL